MKVSTKNPVFSTTMMGLMALLTLSACTEKEAPASSGSNMTGFDIDTTDDTAAHADTETGRRRRCRCRCRYRRRRRCRCRQTQTQMPIPMPTLMQTQTQTTNQSPSPSPQSATKAHSPSSVPGFSSNHGVHTEAELEALADYTNSTSMCGLNAPPVQT